MNNWLLRNLPEDEMGLLKPHLIKVPLVLRQVLYLPDHRITDLHFLLEGIVSLTITVSSHNSETEVGLIGYEGVAPATALLGDQQVAHQAIVQVAGSALRLNVETARSLLPQCPEFRTRCFEFTASLMHQTAQIAACNLRHSVMERLARWLLMVRDRLHDDKLPLTQEFLSIMLGVRRPGVSVAGSTLQAAGIIRQERGRIVILDREALAASACECYAAIRKLSHGGHNKVRFTDT